MSSHEPKKIYHIKNQNIDFLKASLNIFFLAFLFPLPSPPACSLDIALFQSLVPFTS